MCVLIAFLFVVSFVEFVKEAGQGKEPIIVAKDEENG